jgi:desulfoferrodoxin-like iron-binding protein
MAKAKKGDRFTCELCGLVVAVDEFGDSVGELICCDVPMEKGKAARKTKKKAAKPAKKVKKPVKAKKASPKKKAKPAKKAKKAAKPKAKAKAKKK